MSRYHKESLLAVELVKNAAKITEWFRNEQYKSYLKNDHSPVTIVDLASQIYIISELKKYFPEDQIIAEEENTDLINLELKNYIFKCLKDLNFETIDNIEETLKFRGKSSKRQWTIDPIDGTIGYQKKLCYAIGVGLMERSDPKISAIAVPNYNQKGLAIFMAEKSQGAKASYGFQPYIPINVSSHKTLNTARMYHSLHYDEPWVISFAERVGIKNRIQIDSMAKFCMVADGSADLYIKPLHPNSSFSWDYLPGDLLVREAGGCVSYLNNEPLRFQDKKCLVLTPGYIVSNGILHGEIIEHLKKISINH